MTALFEVGAADVADTSDDRYTPRWIFDAAGLTFDMDVAAPVDPSRRTCPARRYLTPIEDGLFQPWDGLVWMNPPYSNPAPWIDRWVTHGCGLALLPASRNAAWMGVLLRTTDVFTLISPRFKDADGLDRPGAYINVLAACGEVSAEAVGRIAQADRCMQGAVFRSADKYVKGAYHVRPAAL